MFWESQCLFRAYTTDMSACGTAVVKAPIPERMCTQPYTHVYTYTTPLENNRLNNNVTSWCLDVLTAASNIWTWGSRCSKLSWASARAYRSSKSGSSSRKRCRRRTWTTMLQTSWLEQLLAHRGWSCSNIIAAYCFWWILSIWQHNTKRSLSPASAWVRVGVRQWGCTCWFGLASNNLVSFIDARVLDPVCLSVIGPHVPGCQRHNRWIYISCEHVQYFDAHRLRVTAFNTF